MKFKKSFFHHYIFSGLIGIMSLSKTVFPEEPYCQNLGFELGNFTDQFKKLGDSEIEFNHYLGMKRRDLPCCAQV